MLLQALWPEYLVQAMMVAWAETMVRGAGLPNVAASAGAAGEGGSAPAPPPLKMGVDTNGRIVAGVAGFDAVQRLFATEEHAKEVLRRGGLLGREGVEGSGPQLRISTRLKNFSL
jgi:hypothetical protein